MDKNKYQSTKNTNKNTGSNFMKEEFGNELDTGAVKKTTTQGSKNSQQYKKNTNEDKKTT